jgi:small nuclear ribonucleoprotein (snRNP)-like protein
MTELTPRISRHILSQLEGELVRVILKDGKTLQGIVRGVDERELHLNDEVVSLTEMSTYFIIKEDEEEGSS